MNVIIVPWENKFRFPKPFSVPKRKTLRLLSFHWEITLHIPRGDSHCVFIMHGVLKGLQLISK